MSTLNRNFMTFGGEPITGRTPTQILVYGDTNSLTGDQRNLVEHAYKLFTDSVRLSAAAAGYHVQNKVLPDGTRIRMESNSGLERVMVWPVGGDEEYPIIAASPRYLGTFLNGDPNGEVVYFYTLRRDGIKKLKENAYKEKVDELPLDQQPGNRFWYDSRPAETKEFKHILGWWGPASSTGDEGSPIDRLGDNEVEDWGSSRYKQYLYHNGKKLFDVGTEIYGAALQKVDGVTYLNIITFGSGSYGMVRELNLYSKELSSVNQESVIGDFTLTTITISTGLYGDLLKQKYTPFSPDGAHFLFLAEANESGYGNSLRKFTVSGTETLVFQSTLVDTGITIPALSIPYETYVDSENYTINYTENIDESRTREEEIVLAADYRGDDIVFYTKKETYTFSDVQQNLFVEEKTFTFDVYGNDDELTTGDYSSAITEAGSKYIAIKEYINGAGTELFSVGGATFGITESRSESLVYHKVHTSYVLTTDAYSTTRYADTVYSAATSWYEGGLFACDPRIRFVSTVIFESPQSEVNTDGHFFLRTTVRDYFYGTETHSESSDSPCDGTYAALESVPLASRSGSDIVNHGSAWPHPQYWHETDTVSYSGGPTSDINVIVQPAGARVRAEYDIPSANTYIEIPNLLLCSVSSNCLLVPKLVKNMPMALILHGMAFFYGASIYTKYENFPRWRYGYGSTQRYNAAREDDSCGVISHRHYFIASSTVTKHEHNYVAAAKLPDGEQPKRRTWLSSPMFVQMVKKEVVK